MNKVSFEANELRDGDMVHITCSPSCDFFNPIKRSGCTLKLAEKHYHPKADCPVHRGGRKKMKANFVEI